MNKLAVITGGSRGIGKAIVQIFAQNKFDIITCSRNESELTMVKKEIESEYPEINIAFLKADLSEKKEVMGFADNIKSRGSVDVLVNNAGYFLPGSIHKEEDGVLESMISANLYSAYHLSRQLIPGMISRKKGHIFNICSTASIMPYVNGGSYCISKFAMYGMSKVLREEMKPYGVKVTAVLPGATKTSSWEGVDLPEERFIKPDDIAHAIWGIYNLSDNTDVEEILIRPQLGDI